MSADQKHHALVVLIGICLIIFVSLAFMKAVWYFRFPKEMAPVLFNKNVLGLFSLPASWQLLAEKPWTPLTFMFVHDNVWNLFGNMLWLWFFGYVLHSLRGGSKTVPVFLYGGLAGALAFIITNLILSSGVSTHTSATVSGAYSGVTAVAIVTTLMSPGYRIFPLIAGGIPLWALSCLYLISVLASVSTRDPGLLSVHLGGALMGLIFFILLKKGYDGSIWINQFFEWVNYLFHPGKPRKGKEFRSALYYKSSGKPFIKTPNITQQRIDEILDKISRKGYHSLTDDEKDLLRRASEEQV